VRLVECADQVGARIGQRETLAVALVRLAQGERGVAGGGVGLHRHQVLGVGAVRRLEQHAGRMPLAALRRGERPGSVVQCQRDASGQGRIALPGGDMARERQLGERFAEPFLQRGGRRGRVEPGQGIGLDLGRRLPLHELALAFVQRCQRVVAFRQRAHRVPDAEERTDEVVDPGRQLDQQRGFGGGIERVGCRPGATQPCAEAGIGGIERLQEGCVQHSQAVALVELFETQPVGEREHRRAVAVAGEAAGRGVRPCPGHNDSAVPLHAARRGHAPAVADCPPAG
jgi:hypothetical protein